MNKEKLKKGTLKKPAFEKGNKLKKGNQSEKQFITKNMAGLIALGVVMLLGIIIYSNSFQCTFHLDDSWIIVNNPSILSLSDMKAWMSFFPTRPVAIFTFALNYHFNQIDVQYYHYVNLIIHLISAGLVWWLTLLIFSSPAIKNSKLAGYKKSIALLVALMFVSHPLATQAVTYIAQRMASLAAMFYLLSLALYMHGRSNGKSNIHMIILFAASFLSAVLAVLTKENAYTLPLAIVMFEFFFNRTSKITINFKDYRLYLIIAGFCALFTLLYLKFSFSVFNTIPPDNGRTYALTPKNYLFTEFSVIVKYIQLLVLPINQNLDYDYRVAHNFFELRTLLSFLLLVALFGLALFFYKKNRIISFGIFWFFLTLSVESSVIPLNDFIDEYRTYLPSFGFLLAVSCGLFILFREKYKYLLVAVFTIMIGSNSILAYNMNKIWKDELSLWTDVVSKSPGKARPHINLGNAYANMGMMDKALAEYSQAITIDPSDAVAFYNRGVYYKEMEQWDNAIADLTKAIQIKPQSVDAYFNRGMVYGSQGKFDMALSDFSKGISYDPQNADLYSSRGVVYGNMGQWDKAVAEYSKAIEINPAFADTYSNRGAAYTNMGLYDKAISDFTKAIEMDPKHEAAFTNRGFSYSKLQQWDKAIADYTKALEINPNNNVAYSQREFAYQNVNAAK